MHYFNQAGWPFIAIFIVVTAIISFFGWPFFVVGAILTVWCFYFFRDPERTTPTKPGLIVSPADGKVVAVKLVEPEAGLGLGPEARIRISVFLNVFDVHVNRIPADSTVRARFYRPGKFVNAAFDKASVDNERMALVLQLGGSHPYSGQLMGCVQIAGLVARRIICTAMEGQSFRAGERYGLIRFGSRADIYLPPGLQPMVSVGQRAVAGETVLADCAAVETARAGEVRL